MFQGAFFHRNVILDSSQWLFGIFKQCMAFKSIASNSSIVVSETHSCGRLTLLDAMSGVPIHAKGFNNECNGSQDAFPGVVLFCAIFVHAIRGVGQSECSYQVGKSCPHSSNDNESGQEERRNDKLSFHQSSCGWSRSR